jgi:hypothetical protein
MEEEERDEGDERRKRRFWRVGGIEFIFGSTRGGARD